MLVSPEYLVSPRWLKEGSGTKKKADYSKLSSTAAVAIGYGRRQL
jgi:hypothetical protein